MRVIIVDCENMPGLLDDGEWNYYMLSDDIKNCKCKKVTEWIKDSKYVYRFSV